MARCYQLALFLGNQGAKGKMASLSPWPPAGNMSRMDQQRPAVQRLVSQLVLLCAVALSRADFVVTSYGDFANGAGGYISRLNANGSQLSQRPEPGGAHNLALDHKGAVYVSRHHDGVVVRSALAETQPRFWCGPGTVRGATGMVFDSRGQLYLTDYSAGRILRYDQLGKNGIVFASGLSRPDHMLIRNDVLYVACLGAGTVEKFSLNGTWLGNIATGMNEPVGMTCDSAGHLWVSAYVGGNIRRFDAVTGVNLGDILTGLLNPHGILKASDGLLYIAEQGRNQILRCTETGGNLTVFSAVSHPVDIKELSNISIRK